MKAGFKPWLGGLALLALAALLALFAVFPLMAAAFYEGGCSAQHIARACSDRAFWAQAAATAIYAGAASLAGAPIVFFAMRWRRP